MSEWKEYKLIDLIKKIVDNRGKNPPYSETGFEVIETGCISKNKKHPDYSLVKKFVDDVTYNNWFRSGHPYKDDILIVTVGNGIGTVSIMPETRGVLTQNLIGLRFKKSYDPNFYYYYLNQSNVQDYLKGMDIGSAQPSLKVPHLCSINVPVPSIQKQKSIASILSSLDDKIDLLHRQNKTLESMAETLFRQWFIEEAQDDWEEGVIPDEFDFTMGQSPPGHTYNEKCTGTPMFQGNADFSFRFPKERIYTTEPKRIAQPNDTLISVRAPVGAQNMAKTECCIGRGVSAFRYKHEKYYTYTYFKLRSIMDKIKKFNDEGTVFGSITKSNFEKMEIVIPDKNTIDKFEKSAKSLNDKIIKNCFQIELLEKLRNILLPKLMMEKIKI